MQVKLQLHKQPGGAGRQIRRTAHWVFLSLGLVALGYCALVYFRGVYYQAYESREFENLLKSSTPAAPAVESRHSGVTPKITPTQIPSTAISKNGSIGRMQIPRLGISVMVVEGVDSSRLELGAGHVPGTALPGEQGNVAIAGHRDTFFRKLRDLQRNDTIEFTTLSGTYNYSVESMEIVGPTDVDVLRPTEEPQLTLVTCFPFTYIGPAPRRFIVQAHQISPTVSEAH
jgi:sortase A